MRLSGIYKITNRVTNECYIGQSVALDGRWGMHINSLCKGKHHSRYFQNSFNQHGLTAFIFEVVELCPCEILSDREKHWFEKLKPALNAAIVGFPGRTRDNPRRPRQAQPSKPCETCGKPISSIKNRFCSECRKAQRAEMVESGYLVHGNVFEDAAGHMAAFVCRDRDSREVINDTKYGRQC